MVRDHLINSLMVEHFPTHILTCFLFSQSSASDSRYHTANLLQKTVKKLKKKKYGKCLLMKV